VSATVTDLVGGLVDDLASGAPAATAARLDQLSRRVREPLAIAVAGRVKAGKSTFVNAVLGQRVARTDARECTRVVTWFRFGPTQRVTVVGRDGQRRVVGLERSGLIPEDLGVPVEAIDRIDVELSLDRLRTFTLADTPGLSSTDAETSGRTADLLAVDAGSQAAIAGAEAVLYVMNQTVRQTDLDVLQGFRALSRDAGNDASSAFAVLNKSDLFDGPDPMATGARVATRHATALRGHVAGVVAYSGLYAEVARCGVLTEADARSLEALADLDLDRRERMLSSQKSFAREPVDIDAETRTRLWVMLRENGLRLCLEAISAGHVGAAALCRQIHRQSGHDVVDGHIGELFERYAPVIKASRALDDLERQAWADPGPWGDGARDRIEALRLSAPLHQLNEFAVLARVRRGEVTLPTELADDLADLVAIPVADRRNPEAGLRRWQAYANSDVSPTQNQAARVIVRSYELVSRTDVSS
jgi:hypothetical protein